MADGRFQEQSGSEAGGGYSRIRFTKPEKCCGNGEPGIQDIHILGSQL